MKSYLGERRTLVESNLKDWEVVVVEDVSFFKVDITEYFLFKRSVQVICEALFVWNFNPAVSYACKTKSTLGEIGIDELWGVVDEEDGVEPINL